jgi:hypothetical protein
VAARRAANPRAALAREPGHAHQPIHHDTRTHAPFSVRVEKMVAVVKVSSSVLVMEGVGVYRKRVVGHEHRAAVLDRSGRVGAMATRN